MEFVANEGKNAEMQVGDEIYLRQPIKTHFVKQGESYIDVVEKYVKPVYEEGDIISISEKIISLCQNRVVKREDIKIGFWAKLLSKFASHPDTGVGVGETIKMQYAINTVGLLRVLWASIASAVTKLFGKKGVFYEIVGLDVSGLDGFYDHIWAEYRDIGIQLPDNPDKVCNEIKEKLGISAMIVDANDLGQVILGKSDDIEKDDENLVQMISDNPAGQGRETTPIVLIRKKNQKDMEEKMNNELVIKRCKHCGALVKVLEDCGCKCGIECCNEQMEKLVPNSVDAAIEKHVPTYEKVEDEIFVKVNHVMEKGHYIEWISLVKENKEYTVKLYPEQEAEARFKYIPGSTLYAYCNKHGLWKAEVE